MPYWICSLHSKLMNDIHHSSGSQVIARNLSHVYSMAIHKDILYWRDLNSHTIFNCNKSDCIASSYRNFSRRIGERIFVYEPTGGLQKLVSWKSKIASTFSRHLMNNGKTKWVILSEQDILKVKVSSVFPFSFFFLY